MDNILGKSLKPQRLTKTSIDQFKIVAKYLCFVASAAKVTVGDKVDKQAGDIVQKFGTAENIKTWILTPQQLSVLANSEGLDYVILMGPNGSGKSMLLKEAGKQKAAQGTKVVYGFFANAEKTLLYFIIKKELEEYGIHVVCFNTENGLDSHLLRGSYVFFDEIWNVKKLEKLFKVVDTSECRGVWIVLNAGSDVQVEKNFPSFQLIKLDLGLRNTKKILKEIKEADVNINSATFVMNNSLNPSLKILDHMPEGQDIITIDRKGLSTFKEMIQSAISHLKDNMKTLICILDFHVHVKKMTAEILSVFEEEKRPLVYLFKNGLNDRDEDIEEWVVNPESFRGRALITDGEMVPGFEADMVIGIGSGALDYFISRARVLFIHIDDDLSEFDSRNSYP